jgi:hypothetical protein
LATTAHVFRGNLAAALQLDGELGAMALDGFSHFL